MINKGASSADANARFYGSLHKGQLDYWKKMAAPRHRLSVFFEFLKNRDPLSLIDLGCGDGTLLKTVIERFHNLDVCGMDLAEEQISINRSLFPNIDWRVGNLDAIDPPATPQKRFSVVSALELIEHVDSPERLLTRARTLVSEKPKGALFLSTQSGPVGETERRVGHRRHFTAMEIEKLLTASGWRPERVWQTGFPFHDWSKRLANISPGFSMKQFGEKKYTTFQNFICLALRFAFLFNSKRRGNQLFAIASPA